MALARPCYWCHEMVQNPTKTNIPIRWIARLFGHDGLRYAYDGAMHFECEDAYLRFYSPVLLVKHPRPQRNVGKPDA